MSMDIHQQKILILDFGSQYTQLIARKIREIGVYSEIMAWDANKKEVLAINPSAIILSGGPETVTAEYTPRAPDFIFDLGLPILGICYGMQTLAEQLGGTVKHTTKHEFGYAHLVLNQHSSLLEGIEDDITTTGESTLDVWMSHGDQITQTPEGFKVIARTSTCPIAAIAHEEHQIYGVQFHPEVTHTHQGKRILERFVIDIAGCKKQWTPNKIIKDAIARIQQKVGDKHVILGLSGGVDSSVTAALIHKAIGKQLTCIFVDNGLLRLNEDEEVMAMFAQNMGLNVIKIDAAERFLNNLSGISDPEEKRKIIGNTFIEVFEEAAQHQKNAQFLAQGTIYPDVIESAASKTGKAHVIKSHHNVGGLPEDMKLKLVEPLKELFKDEVRTIGLELGLPYNMLYRHPFPGPGLGVRILGKVTQQYADTLRLADAIYIGELEKAGLYHKVNQAFAVFLPIKSVGVVGDARRYEYVIALRAVETIDFMTARWAHLPYDFLEIVSRRIINEIPNISRVTYDISSKPPATIEWE